LIRELSILEGEKKNGDAGGTTKSKMPVVVVTRFGAVRVVALLILVL
jgi:hypothetical protein